MVASCRVIAAMGRGGRRHNEGSRSRHLGCRGWSGARAQRQLPRVPSSRVWSWCSPSRLAVVTGATDTSGCRCYVNLGPTIRPLVPDTRTDGLSGGECRTANGCWLRAVNPDWIGPRSWQRPIAVPASPSLYSWESLLSKFGHGSEIAWCPRTLKRRGSPSPFRERLVRNLNHGSPALKLAGPVFTMQPSAVLLPARRRQSRRAMYRRSRRARPPSDCNPSRLPSV